MGKERINFYSAFLYLLVGIVSTITSLYLTVKYFLISGNSWYILDISIDFLMLLALFGTFVILLQKTSETVKILLF
ncbi:MAG TPA: hypothetical protein VFK23_07945, partial [Nitrospirota bacterium]|nr:hypothetical protein [Nitrospirota bacterium]